MRTQTVAPISASLRSMKTHRAIGAVVAVAALAWTMTACTSSVAEYALLEQPATENDTLPSFIETSGDSGADLSTARLAGEYENTSVWLVGSEDENELCAVIVPAPTGEQNPDWVMGCSGRSGLTVGNSVAGNFTVVPDGVPGPEGYTKVSENVYTP